MVATASRPIELLGEQMNPVAGGILVMLLIPVGFLSWVMFKAMIANKRMVYTQTAKLPRRRRAWVRLMALGGIFIIAAGGIIGIVLRPDPNIFASEVIGVTAAGGVWFVIVVILASTGSLGRPHNREQDDAQPPDDAGR